MSDDSNPTGDEPVDAAEPSAAGDVPAAEEGAAAPTDDPAHDVAAELDADAEAALAEAAEVVENDLVTLSAERDQFLDAYRRTQADFENFRKQAQKRLTDEVSRTLGGFVERLLPVLDAGDAAISHGAEGAAEVYGALLGALEKEGLERLELEGEPFDPNLAEAVMHEPGDGDTQVVSEVLRTGYRWKEKVLRPAMVKVQG